MSIYSLKVELGRRNGREALPNFFPVDLIISLTRELALVIDRSQSFDDLVEMRSLILDYLRKVLQMQGSAYLLYFDSRQEELLPALGEELYEFSCAELVSRMIGYDVQKESLHERFSRLLDEGSDGHHVPGAQIPQEEASAAIVAHAL